MLRFVGRRLMVSLPVLVIVVLVSFLLIDVMPGDAARVLAGERATEQDVAAARAQLGLDDPLPARFGSYVADVVGGDLGTSLFTGRGVWESIAEAAPPTASLLAVGMLMALLLGGTFGTAAAVLRDTWVDRGVSGLAALFTAVPPFVIALLLIAPLALDRSIFPSTGYADAADGLGEWLRSITLPAFCLALPAAAELARQTRGALVDALDEDFVRTARAAGIGEVSVVGKHALKNAGVPIVTVAGLQVGRFLGSALVVEQVFAIPGFGSLAYSAVTNQDVPLIQGIVLVSGIVVLLSNLAVDVTYGYLNPEMR
jgi:peptide/nickel transport system permease protein